MSADDLEAAFKAALSRLEQDYPDIDAVELFVTDLNGVARGKLLPATALPKLVKGGARMPVSSVGLDIFGSDVAESNIAIEIGDPDGALMPAPETLAPMLWAERPCAQVIATMTTEDKVTPAAIDPRGALQRVVDRAAERGLTPVVAVEIEFYLIDIERDAARRPQPPIPPRMNERLHRQQIYDMSVLRAFEPLMAEIAEASRAAGAPADTAICEFGPGQFEINLVHMANAVSAADHAIALKRAIRGVARKNGYDATFMAKPYGLEAGSGMHVHLSFVDANGSNVFATRDADGAAPNALMRGALSGVLSSMPDAMPIWAPHYNSYRRFAPGSYAPLCAAWGTDNRGVALRCPETEGPGARIEHRVSGADANPYLVVAAVIAGALKGMAEGGDPGPPIAAEAGRGDGAPLPASWTDALAAWSASDFVADTFGETLRHVYSSMKRQEQATLMAQVSDAEYDAYLRAV